MRAALLLVLLALPAGAVDRNPNRQQRCDRRDRLCASDFSAFRLLATTDSIPGGECSGQAITGTRGEAVTFTRASSATCTKSDGTLVQLSSNQPRVSLVGGVPMLLVEGGATNSFLNSGAPATQTITHATSTFTLWMDGTGSIAAAVGTATASGLPCTASSGTACTFTVSAGGTVVYTVTGSPTRAQAENTGFRTSYIVTAGTAATRSADLVSVPNMVADGQGCVGADLFMIGFDSLQSPARVFNFGTGFVGGLLVTTTVVDMFDGTNEAQKTVTNMIGRRTANAIGTWSGSTLTARADGLTAASTTYDGALVASPIYLGSRNGANQFYGYLGNARLGASAGACDR